MNRPTLWIVKLTLTAMILAAIVWKLDFAAIRAAFASLAPAAIPLAFLIIVIQAICTGLRLGVIVSTFGHPIPALHAVRISIESIFFGQTFVSFIGSDALRVWRVRRAGLSLDQAGAAVALDRVLGIMVNHALLLVSLPWLLGRIDSEPVRLILIALALAGIAGTAAVLLLGYFRDGIVEAASRITGIRAGRIAGFAAQAITAGQHLLRPPPRLLLAAAISLLSALCNSLVFFVLLLGWQVDAVTALLASLLVPAVLEIAMLPISIAGWGVREGAAVVAFGTLGIPAVMAFGASVLFALLTLVLGLSGGVSWLLARRPAPPKGEAGTDRPAPLRAE
jgi:glycosyltransferase 2 family protein